MMMMIFMNHSSLLRTKNNEKICPQFEIRPPRRLDKGKPGPKVKEFIL